MEKEREISYFSLTDWDFKSEDSRSFLHNFCWYPARFIPIIPSYLIQALSRPNDTVLDPFCGSGTTIVESLKLGRNAIGVDINPMGCFLTTTKVEILKERQVDVRKLKEFVTKLSGIESAVKQTEHLNRLFVSNRLPFMSIKKYQIPNYAANQEWYNPKTLKMLGYLYRRLENLPSGPTQNIGRLFFISILIPSSGHENRKPYTYFADNVCPKAKEFKNAISLYLQKLTKFISEFSEHKKPRRFSSAKVIAGDARNLRDILGNTKRIDLIVTSPPYLNVTDYTKAYRLAYLWDYFPKDIENAKRQEIGARWKRRQARSFDDYIEALKVSLENMVLVLKRKGYLCLILGEAQKYRERIRKVVASFMTNEMRMRLVKTFSRNISKKFFMNPKGGVLSEDILIFRKEE